MGTKITIDDGREFELSTREGPWEDIAFAPTAPGWEVVFTDAEGNTSRHSLVGWWIRERWAQRKAVAAIVGWDGQARAVDSATDGELHVRIEREGRR